MLLDVVRLLALSCALLAVLAGTAHAKVKGPLVPPPGDYTLVLGQCPGLLTHEGCVDLGRGVIYLRPGSLHLLAHEEGHLYDWRFLSDGEREAFRRLTRAPRGWPWWITVDEQRAVSEWFADAYATCVLGRLEGWPGFWMNPYIGRGRRVCSFIASSWS